MKKQKDSIELVKLVMYTKICMNRRFDKRTKETGTKGEQKEQKM